MTPFERSIARVFRDGALHHRLLTRRAWLNTGYETIRPGMPYDWDGIQRGGKAAQPVWLFQFTLHGWGWLETEGHRRKIPAGSAFSVRIPSRHRYHADPTCEEWRFFWLMVRQPYIIERLLRIPQFDNRVIRFADEAASPLLSIRQLLQAAAPEEVADAHRLEVQLLTAVFELERWAFLARHPSAKRDTFLESVRRRMKEAPSVSELASGFGMSRTHFSHYFRRTTGESPATFMKKSRLKQVENLLVTSTLSIKEIAANAGFSSTNHLCKAFRAHYQVSPGDYRRMAPSSRETRKRS